MRKVIAAISVALLAIGISLAGASPAQASVVFGCSNEVPNQFGQICLYDWVNYNQGGSSKSININWAGQASCRELSSMTYPNGAAINNTASSLVINTFPEVRITFFDWVGCNYSGGWAMYWVKQGEDGLRLSPNLGSIQDANQLNGGTNFYDKFTSFKVE